MGVEKPAELHWLQGTQRTRPSRAAGAGETVPGGRPRYPRGLTTAERREFKAACFLLESRRQLTPGDGPLLETYAVIRARWLRARQAIETHGEYETLTRLDSNGVAHESRRHSLEYKTAVDCEKNLTALADRLGFTPLNRAKVKAAGAAAEKQVAAQAAAETEKEIDDLITAAPWGYHGPTMDEILSRKSLGENSNAETETN